MRSKLRTLNSEMSLFYYDTWMNVCPFKKDYDKVVWRHFFCHCSISWEGLSNVSFNAFIEFLISAIILFIPGTFSHPPPLLSYSINFFLIRQYLFKVVNFHFPKVFLFPVLPVSSEFPFFCCVSLFYVRNFPKMDNIFLHVQEVNEKKLIISSMCSSRVVNWWTSG